MATIEYYLDGISLKSYGVYVSEAQGLFDRPKNKPLTKTDWAEYHGEVVDLDNIRLSSREIVLICFIKAVSILDFAIKVNTFLQIYSAPGTKRLLVQIDVNNPLVYEVYCEDGITIRKKWSDGTMVGTFQIKLTEPDPVKKVLKYTRLGVGAKTVTITLTSEKLLGIFWGDGTKTLDVSGTGVVITHDYAADGSYFIIIAGNIDEITNLTHNATVVWNKL